MNQFCMETAIEAFEEMTKDPKRLQRDILRKILEENADTEYFRNFGLEGRTDEESFKKCIPLCTHQDLEPYIQRIADGDTSAILTSKPITSLSFSSGTTTGKPKLIPFNDAIFYSAVQTYLTSSAFRNREYPISNGKVLQFVYGSKVTATEGGLTVSTASINVLRHSRWDSILKDNQTQICSPDAVIFGSDFHQSLYCHLLCGLIYYDEVQFVTSINIHNIVNAFRTLENIWEDLCTDIRDGVLSERITDPEIHQAMSKILRPNAKLADRIYVACAGSRNWYGIIPQLWPNAKYVSGIMTGSMEPYVKKLRHYAGHLPLISGDYVSSEGCIGANVNPSIPPEEATFVVLPNIGYLEFMPLERSIKENLDSSASVQYLESEPVGLTEVEVGKTYAPVLTIGAGVYRYRFGDVVQVSGFHNLTPKLKFICRLTPHLTINGNKNTEKDLQLAVEEASKLLADEKLDIIDFTSHVDRSTNRGHYVISWELSSDATDKLLHNCANCLDLAFQDDGYVLSRKTNAIGPLELRVMTKGTFQKIMARSVELGATVSQFKTPRFVNPSNQPVLQILNQNVVKSYYSTAYANP